MSSDSSSTLTPAMVIVRFRPGGNRPVLRQPRHCGQVELARRDGERSLPGDGDGQAGRDKVDVALGSSSDSEWISVRPGKRPPSRSAAGTHSSSRRPPRFRNCAAPARVRLRKPPASGATRSPGRPHSPVKRVSSSSSTRRTPYTRVLERADAAGRDGPAPDSPRGHGDVQGRHGRVDGVCDGPARRLLHPEPQRSRAGRLQPAALSLRELGNAGLHRRRTGSLVPLADDQPGAARGRIPARRRDGVGSDRGDHGARFASTA